MTGSAKGDAAALEADVLAAITPTPEEAARLDAAAKSLAGACDEALGKLGLPGRAEVQGSVAKGTWLRGSADIDLFLLLDPSVPAERLDALATDVGRRVLQDAHKKYAQHPYLQGKFQSFSVDLVPAYAVPSASGKMSAVDRTPFHTAWVRGALDDAGRAQVRLLKAWMKGTGVYGADTATGGFSGYLAEVLAVRFEGFHGVLEWLSKGAQPRRIALGPDQCDAQDTAALVVIDPVDPTRNCAAAVTAPVLGLACEAAKAYLAKPAKAFFHPAPPRAEPAAALHKALHDQGACWLALRMTARTDRLDIVLPQFHRAARSVAAALEDAGFKAHRHQVTARDRDVLMQWVVADTVLPETRTHFGPLAHVEPNASRFREKWEGHPDTVGPVKVVDGKLAVEVANRERTAAEHLERRIDAASLGRHVQHAMADHEAYADPAEVPDEWGPVVADLVLDRRPWQR